MSTQFTSPDTMIAAAAHVEREYGYSGYRLGCETALVFGGGIFAVRASDGGEFRLFADRYGNVSRLPDVWDEMSTDQRQSALSDLVAS